MEPVPHSQSNLALKKLLNKIRNQKDQWTSRNVAETQSEVETIESGTITSRERRLCESEPESDPICHPVPDTQGQEGMLSLSICVPDCLRWSIATAMIQSTLKLFPWFQGVDGACGLFFSNATQQTALGVGRVSKAVYDTEWKRSGHQWACVNVSAFSFWCLVCLLSSQASFSFSPYCFTTQPSSQHIVTPLPYNPLSNSGWLDYFILTSPLPFRNILMSVGRTKVILLSRFLVSLLKSDNKEEFY